MKGVLLNILAYIDPGSGSYLIQLLLAGILGVYYYLKGSKDKILSFFGKKKAPEKDESGQEK